LRSHLGNDLCVGEGTINRVVKFSTQIETSLPRHRSALSVLATVNMRPIWEVVTIFDDQIGIYLVVGEYLMKSNFGQLQSLLYSA